MSGPILDEAAIRELASNSGAPITIFLAVTLLYLVLTLPLTQLVRWLETRGRPGRE